MLIRPATHDKSLNRLLDSLPSIKDFSSSKISEVKGGWACLRRSSVKQSKNQSFETQLLTILEMGQGHGVQIFQETVILEEATSGFNNGISNRPEMLRLKNLILSNDYPWINFIYFYDETRADRTGISFFNEFETPIKRFNPNIRIVSASSGNDMSSKNLSTIREQVSAMQHSEVKMNQAVEYQYRKTNMGERVGGAIPYGYEIYDKSLKVDPDARTQTGVVVFIFHMSSLGYSLEEICHHLNVAGIPTPKNGKSWSPETVNLIFNNPVYIGGLRRNFKKGVYQGETVELENCFESLIPKSLYYLAHGVRDLKRKYQTFNTPYIFTDLLECKTCKSKLKNKNLGNKSRPRKIYYCPICNNRESELKFSIHVEELNQLLLEKIQKKLDSQQRQLEDLIKEDLSSVLNSLNKEIKFKKNDLDKMKFLERKSEYDTNEDLQYIREEISAIQRDILQIKKRIEMMKDIQQESPSSKLKVNLFELSQSERRLFLLIYIKKITITFISDSDVKVQINYDFAASEFLMNLELSV